MTSSFFFVLSLRSLTSSSLSRSSTRLPAAFKNVQTELAMSSALWMPLSFRPLVYASADDSLEAGRVLFVFGEELLEINPDVRTIAPVSRESMSVLCTPGFWPRRVRRASVSSGYSSIRTS
jgi:hypothetical protein